MIKQQTYSYLHKTLTMLLMACMLFVCLDMNAAPKKKKSKRKPKLTAVQKQQKKYDNQNVHHLSLWGDGGYANMHNNEGRMDHGGGTEVGFGYALRKNHFLLQTGPEVRFLGSSERQLTSQVMLPFTMGGQWNNFYFLAGGKIGYNVWDQDVLNSRSIPTGLETGLTAEAGLYLNDWLSKEWNDKNEQSKHPWRLRASIFADYNFAIPSSERFNNLLVGVKFTAWMQFNKPKVPNPFIIFSVTDENLLPTKGITTVETRDINKPKRKPKTKNLKKNGTAIVRYAKGTYKITAHAPGFEPSDTLIHMHETDMDTVRIQLKPIPQVVCYVHDSVTEKQIVADLDFRSVNDQQHHQINQTAIDNPCVLKLHYGHQYLVQASAPAFYNKEVSFTADQDTIHIYLRPKKRTKQVLLLKHMYFDSDKTGILSPSESDMLRLYQFLSHNPKVRVLITGHTDSDGSALYNKRLSLGRAQSVKNEMVKRGIDGNRISIDGKGESEPIDTNLTEAGKQKNRRVQVTVLNAEDAEEEVL